MKEIKKQNKGKRVDKNKKERKAGNRKEN